MPNGEITFWDVLKYPFKVPQAIYEHYAEGIGELALTAALEYDPEPAYPVGTYDAPVVRQISTGNYIPMSEWRAFGAWSADYEVLVHGTWMSALSQGARLVLGRAMQSMPTSEGVLGTKYGTVEAMEQPGGIWWEGQFYALGGLGAVVPVAIYSYLEERAEIAAHLVTQTAEAAAGRAAAELEEARTAMVTVTDPLVGTVTTTPTAPATQAPTAETALGGVRTAAVIGAAGLAATAFGAWMARRGQTTGDRAPALEARKAALTGAMLAAGWLPLPAGTTAKHPKKWWHPVSGSKVTLPGKRRGRGITPSDVKTVRRVHNKFKSLAKSLGYAFSSGGRGTVKATSGRFKKGGGRHRHKTA